ncbi:hypothetical protein MMC30_005882 [Trapelia coarctata]|nr:hypothetical protein [Trapelia coarctata]
MRPPRLVLLLICFVALPVFLTFFSLLYSHPRHRQQTESTVSTQKGGLRALFSFHTPTSLFPPSAIISLTDDNSTFFLARPAAFGALLPADGLSGQLWVGSGFGDDSLGRGGATTGAEGELGCSDVPGWGDGKQPTTGEKHGESTAKGKSTIRLNAKAQKSQGAPGIERRSEAVDGAGQPEDAKADSVPSEDDGTDDHLHHPLKGSPVAKSSKPGQPALYENNKDGQPAAHADIQSLQESAEIAGKVVLLSRGGCGFLEKVKWAQRRGGIALIVGDDTRGGALVTMYAHGDTSNVTIPSLFTSHTTAHLLSSLIPPGSSDDFMSEEGSKLGPGDGRAKKVASTKKNGKKIKGSSGRTTFTQVLGQTKPTATPRLITIPTSVSRDTSQNVKVKKSWIRSLGSALGLVDSSSSSDLSTENRRRPPSSGRINWIISDSWADEPINAPQKGNTGKPEKSDSYRKSGTGPVFPPSSGDDFVIGVQDWRDRDLVNHDANNNAAKGKDGAGAATAKTSTTSTAASGKQTALAGGIITPGSGEYETPGSGSDSASDNSDIPDDQSAGWLSRLWSSEEEDEFSTTSQAAQSVYKKKIAPHFVEELEFEGDEDFDSLNDHEGLWVTMTPTTMSTSPFFDTLLVLVVSPLVTLTVVYALLLLRSRIRRRRWRAPKSVVDRLPVRTYHTIPCSPIAATSQISTPLNSSPTSPLLRSSPDPDKPRPRPRSRTTSGITETVASSLENATKRVLLSRGEKSGTKKRYNGKQVECVVCLEEYIDGQSRVMSLPCGHEFHAECITPWLTTRRRTCPICKGDVVRSLAAHSTHSNPSTTSSRSQSGSSSPSPYRDFDEIQAQAVETTNDSPSSAIPIPRNAEDMGDDEDLERGDSDDMAATLVNDDVPDAFSPRRVWRGLAASLSLSAFSGEAAWRQSQTDRNR